MSHPDPRTRRRHRAPEVDALAAAVRLDLAMHDMREQQLAGGPERPDDEPPTGLIDLNAIRALLGQPVTGDVDPAASAWLAGGAEPAAARMVDRIDRLEPTSPPARQVPLAELLPAPTPLELVEHPCAVLGNAFHSSGPCGPEHHPEPAPAEQPAAVLTVTPPAPPPAPEVFGTEHRRPRGWVSRHDPRSLEFGVRRRLFSSAPVTDRMWFAGPVLDQGAEGQCVGYGIVDAVNAMRDHDVDGGAVEAAQLYARAQQLDDTPGTDYTGTSVLAGLKAAVEAGLITAYDWCFGTRDIAQAVLQRGPVVIGIPWLSGMYDTGPGGLVKVEGDDIGIGHCLAVLGVTVRGPQNQLGPYFVWQNSWGPDYGEGGLGYVHHRDLAGLLHGVGEAAVPHV